MTWHEWAERHATVFGMRDGREAAMLVEWARSFDRAGMTPAELALATDHLATHPPEYRTQHLARLTSFVRERRAREDSKNARLPVGDYGCRECSDTGIVCGLPSLRVGVAFPQAWYTCAVACRCPMGQALGQRRGWQTLAQYERENPGWREQVRAREEENLAHGRARAAAAGLDRALGEVLSKVRRSR